MELRPGTCRQPEWAGGEGHRLTTALRGSRSEDPHLSTAHFPIREAGRREPVGSDSRRLGGLSGQHAPPETLRDGRRRALPSIYNHRRTDTAWKANHGSKARNLVSTSPNAIKWAANHYVQFFPFCKIKHTYPKHFQHTDYCSNTKPPSALRRETLYQTSPRGGSGWLPGLCARWHRGLKLVF